MRNGSGPSRGGRLATLGYLAALMLVMAAPAVTAGHVRTLVAFDPAALEFPEGIAADKTGNLYVSMPLLDQIRRIDQDGAQSVHAQLPPGAAPAGLKLDAKRHPLRGGWRPRPGHRADRSGHPRGV